MRNIPYADGTPSREWEDFTEEEIDQAAVGAINAARSEAYDKAIAELEEYGYHHGASLVRALKGEDDV